jgi:hypothetical protein
MVNSFRNWLSRWAKIGPRFGASTDSAREEHDMTEPLQPDPALKLLDRYVGTWDLHGRTLGSEVENVAGQATFEWLPGGFFLQQRVRGQVADFEVQGVEVIGYDPATGTYPSTVYPSMAGTPLAYRWEPDGDELTITTEELGAVFRGRWSPDGRGFSGGWRPIPGREGPGGIAYDITGSRARASGQGGVQVVLAGRKDQAGESYG